ncbi:MAG: hypothetical protein H8E28_13950, partial [Anaerolineae bacterium]|nr:hypothetical protein [Anaerolineae bacterium]
MNELETTQAQENVESTEVVESVEQQAVEEAAVEPGARIEETQTFEQAEAVEGALVEAVDAAEEGEDMQLISGPKREDLPDGTGVLEEPHETVAMAEPLEKRGVVEQAEIPEGIEFELAQGDDDGKDEATPINVPGPEAAEDDDEDMQLISGPKREDLPPGSGILEEPHETVAMAEPLEERGIVEQAEIPEGIEFELAQGDDDGKDEATPINLPGPEAAEDDDEDMQLISGPKREDLPPGSGILEEPHETVEIAEPLEERGIVEELEFPEGVEIEPAGEDGSIDHDDDGRIKNPELSETSGDDDDDKNEATPINLPGPVAAVSEEPEPGPDPFDAALSPDDVKDGVALDHTGPGGQVAAEDDWEAPVASRGEMPDPGGHPPGPNMELTPDDIKLEPAPDYENMNEGERAVVNVIGKAIADEQYRTALFADVRAATAGYAVTPEDQAGLNEMTPEAFEFFAAEVEARFAAAAEQQTLA